MAITDPQFTDVDAYITLGATTLKLIQYEDISQFPYTRPRTEPLPPRPPRTEIPGLTQFEQSPNYGDLFAQGDFSGGSGQTRFHSANRDPSKYWYSEGFDISIPGKLTNARANARITDANAHRAVEIANDLPFYISQTGTTRVMRGNTAFPGSWTGEDPGLGATTCDDLTSDGGQLYAAQTNIYKRNVAGVWSLYTTNSGTAVTRIKWLKNRLMAADGSKIYEVTTSGGTLGTTFTALETLPSGWTFEAIFEYGEYIYAITNNLSNFTCSIHHYGPNQDYSALEKKGETAMPSGQIMYAGASYLGSGYLGGGVKNKGTSPGLNPIVYRCFQDQRGFLTLDKLAVDKFGTQAGANYVGALEPNGEQMLMTWVHSGAFPASASIGSRFGVGAHYLGRDAFAPLVWFTSGTNVISSIRVYRGRVLYLAEGYGLMYEDLSSYQQFPALVTSIADFNNAGQKVWDTFEAKYSRLGGGQIVNMSYLLGPDTGDTQSTILVDSTTNSNGKTVTDTSNTAKSRQLLLMLQPNTNSLPLDIYTISARANPSPTTQEFQITRTYRVLPKDRKDEFGQVQYQDPDAVLASLDGMVNNWVDFQESNRDWTAFVINVTDITQLVPELRTANGTDRDRQGRLIQVQMVAR